MASSPDSVDPQEDQCEAPSDKVSFEQTLTRLEEIVHLLEDGKIGLDEALERYKEGVGLLRQAYETLQRAERKIELLTGLDAEGRPILRPMEDLASFTPARDATAIDSAAGAMPPARKEKGVPRTSRHRGGAESP